MTVSVFGIWWVILLLTYYVNKRYEYLIFLVMLSFVFQASYVFVIGKADINAGIVTCFFVLINTLYSTRGKLKTVAWQRIMLLFVFWTLIISIVAPSLFKGMQIMGITNNEYDFHKFHWETVQLSASNISQCLTIILYALTVVSLYTKDKVVSNQEYQKIYLRVYSVVAILGLCNMALMFFHLPTELYQTVFHNEADIIGDTFVNRYYIGSFSKFISTFYEASYCGAYLAVSSILFLHYFDTSIFIKAFSLVLLAFNLSSTGFVTFLVLESLVIIQNFRRHIISKKRLTVYITLLIVAAILILFNSSIIDNLYAYTIGKTSSGSFNIRTKVDSIALQTLPQTHGLGLGMNSIQTYSLIPSLLAQVGVIGLLLYTFFVARCIKWASHITSEAIITQLMGIIIAQILSIQALNFCLFWQAIFAIAVVRADESTRTTVSGKVDMKGLHN